jgi:hypothetical protein
MNKKIFPIFLTLLFILIITSCKTTDVKVTEETTTAIETTPIQTQEKLEEKETLVEKESSVEYEEFSENISFHLIQLEIITDSDWTTLVTENTEDIKTIKLENKIGEVSKYIINSKYIWLDQGIEAAEQNKKVGLIVNYALSSDLVNETIDFILYKGDLNTTSINIYYISQDGKELIQEMEHSGVAESSASLNPKEFSIDLSILKEFESNKTEIKYKKSIPKAVWAFYYPWYTMDTWDSDVLVDKAISSYESSDPLVIEEHVNQAKSAGIDGFISSWWGPESLTDDNLRVLLDVAKDKDFSISIIFETLSDYGPRDKQEIKDWLEFIIINYGSHPAFAKVEDRPVIVLYETGSVSIDIWKQIIEELRKDGNDAVFLAMGYSIDNLEVFDGIYEYGVFNITDHEALYKTVSSAAHYYQIFNNSNERKIFAATVQPGYDDRLIPGREGNLKDREEGSFYISTFDAAIKSDPDYIFITSWNEWLENTHIEKSEMYGDKYLNITKEYVIKWKEREEVAVKEKEVPTIELEIYEGPTYLEEKDVCYYRVKALVTGNPSPNIEFIRDDSNGALGYEKAQVNLTRDDPKYKLIATTTNSEGKATDSIKLKWDCGELLEEKTYKTGTNNPRWHILVLIFSSVDFKYVDESGIQHHVVTSMTQEEKNRAKNAAKQFFESDVPILTSGNMFPILTIRYPDQPITQLDSFCGYFPNMSNISSECDPTFDSIIVIWDSTGTDLNSGQSIDLQQCGGLAVPNGTGQTYSTFQVDSIRSNDRNIFKHEWGHSILWYFEATGKSPYPTVNNHINDQDTIYVNCITGNPYILEDENDDNPIPNSIYNNYSGFTHDYYSGTTATPDQPNRCIGITPEAWASDGPVTKILCDNLL